MQTLNVEDAFRPRFTVDHWRSLGTYLTRNDVRPGDMIIRQGDRDRCMYLLERGSLQVFVTGGTPGANRIAILRAGAVVGEPSLFYDGERMANVEAMMPSVAWALPGTRLEELAQRNPSVALEFLRAAGAVMAVRMRSNLTRPVPMP
jgi:CRP-like cAMP-binding protein